VSSCLDEGGYKRGKNEEIGGKCVVSALEGARNANPVEGRDIF